MSAAVEGGKLLHVSASQVKTFLRCPRLWYYEKVERLRTDSTGPQNLGTAIHSQMERYYLEGVTPEHPSAKKAVESGVLPARGPGVLIEAELDEPKLFVGGTLFKGRIDMTVPPDQNGVVWIWDWKTTSKPAYMKLGRTLRDDVQMGAYAHWAYQRWPEAKKVRVAHGYLVTTAARGRFEPRWTTVTRLHAGKVWDVVRWAVEQMTLTLGQKDAKNVHGEKAACSDYGGCSFYSKCWSLADILDASGED